ncbi:MAG: xylulokinase, partial [Flavobacteriaceae bacterium]|nr:xylulokinase [Flavobacteriaceae bacterium]
MYLGIDLGTSGLKAALMDDAGNIIDTKSAALSVNSPNPLWSEQNPLDWWSAVESVIDQLSQSHIVSQIKAIGLSGQMHGATLLDEAGSVIRPAILWNDGR